MKAGFGSRLIQRPVAAVFEGTAQITSDPEGVSHEIRSDRSDSCAGAASAEAALQNLVAFATAFTNSASKILKLVQA